MPPRPAIPWGAVGLLPLFLLFFLFSRGPVPAAGAGFPARYLTLERAMPVGAKLEALKARDRARHGRLLQVIPGVVDFPVEGTYNPFSIGLYFTRVKLGNPPKEFYVQIDTGSDILWVTCNPCNGCPVSSGLNIQLEFFDPDTSSTSSLISCADQRCSSALTSTLGCTSSATHSNLCSYTFQYGDGSGTSGYYVSDTMYFETIIANEQALNSSATVIFGCSNSQSGDLTKPDRAVDGIFGFGQHELSVISQLSSLGVAPKVFSHCLKGSDNGGGILVLGEIVEPGIVYTPLVQSQPHYNLNLQSIAVNGQILAIDPSIFATSNTQGTIVDSGTTLAYLVEQAYDPFVNAITASVSQFVQSSVINGNQCFGTSARVDEIFPSVSLNFEGNAVMMLKPQDYLLQQGSVGNSIVWCIGWQKNQGQGITILGDLVLKDKIFVYDLGGQRMGWVNYDCKPWTQNSFLSNEEALRFCQQSFSTGSLPVNVTTSYGKNDVVNAGQLSVSDSSHCAVFNVITVGFMNVLVYILIFSSVLS